MSYKCSKCQSKITPTEAQIKKRNFMCNPCRREYQKANRRKRKESGNPVVSGKMNAEYFEGYNKTYYKKPEVLQRKKLQAREYRKNPELKIKFDARDAVTKALKKGTLKKQPCQVCGANAQAHHPDYTKPLNVVWLCRKHHIEEHKKAKAEGKTLVGS